MWGTDWQLVARRVDPGAGNRLVVKIGDGLFYEQWLVPAIFGDLPTFVGLYMFGVGQPRTFPYGFPTEPDHA